MDFGTLKLDGMEMKVIVFDLGGTLMEYKGMPPSWTDYYSVDFFLLNHRLLLKSKELVELKNTYEEAKHIWCY